MQRARWRLAMAAGGLAVAAGMAVALHGGRPLPTAGTVTGTVTPAPALRGEPVHVTFTWLGPPPAGADPGPVALVGVPPPPAQDADGRPGTTRVIPTRANAYRATGLRFGVWAVEAVGEGDLATARVVLSPAHPAVAVPLRLRYAARAHLVVVGPDGALVDHAGVYRRDLPESGPIATTDVNGRATLTLPRHSGLDVVVAAPGLAPRHAVARTDVAETEVHLAAEVRVAGLVLEGGKPVAGATVARIDARPAPSATTGDDGAFELHGLGPGKVVIRAGRDGHQSAPMPLDLGKGPRDDLVLKLRAPCVPTLRVVDEAGRPVAGARVRLWAGRPVPDRWARWRDAAGGSVQVDDLPLVPVTARATARHHLDVEVPVPAQPGAETVTLTLRTEYDLHIQIRDRAGAAVVGGGVAPSVLVHPLAGPHHFDEGHAFEKGERWLTVRDLPAGPYLVAVTYMRGDRVVAPVRIAIPQVTRLVLHAAPTAPLAGRVVDAGGAPVAHLILTLTRRSALTRAFRPAAFTFAVGTGPDGRFSAHAVLPGDYDVASLDPSRWTLPKGQTVTTGHPHAVLHATQVPETP